jgi:hypothetical protein
MTSKGKARSVAVRLWTLLIAAIGGALSGASHAVVNGFCLKNADPNGGGNVRTASDQVFSASGPYPTLETGWVRWV